jgi:hypothetical protein
MDTLHFPPTGWAEQLEGGFVSIDARGETPTRRRATQHQKSRNLPRAPTNAIDLRNAHPPPVQTLPLIAGTTASPAGSSEIKLHRLPAFT